MSPVFDEMFTAEPDLISKKVSEFFSEGAVEEFVSYFYNRAEPSQENVWELVFLTKKFSIPDLELLCVDIISKFTAPEQALKVYNIASRHSETELKRGSFKALQEHHPEIADFLLDEPELVNKTIEAKHRHQERTRQETTHQAKKIKLTKKN